MKPLARISACALAVSLVVASFVAHPTNAGAAPAKQNAIRTATQKFVDNDTVAGAVTLVARRGEVVSVEAVGYADLAAKKPMREDNLFWIASMTKPMTSVAVLMLQDEGKLSVNDPVEKYLPEFKGQLLLAARTNGQVILKKTRPITLRDLLTHTSGLNAEAPEVGRDLTLAERTLAYALQPLQFEPGSKWQYSNPGIISIRLLLPQHQLVARTA